MTRTKKTLQLLLATSMTFALVEVAYDIVYQLPLFVNIGQHEKLKELRNNPRHVMMDSFSQEKDKNFSCPVHYYIFDAISYKGNLQFLNILSYEWCIFIVNLSNKTQLSDCARCHVLNKRWVTDIVDGKLFEDKLTALPRYAKEKMATIVYALLQGAEWIYVTELPFSPDMKKIMMACSHDDRTGLVYRGPGQVFEPCAHFMDPLTWYGQRTPHFQSLFRIKSVSPDPIYSMVFDCYKKHMNIKSWMRGLDLHAPCPFITAGTFGNVNFQNILVSRHTAWTLVAALPTRELQSYPLSRQTIFLSLMVQRLLWDTSSMIGFMPLTPPTDPLTPPTDQIPSCSSRDVKSTLQEIGQTYLKCIAAWHCNTSHNLLHCLRQLVQDFGQNVVGADIKVILDVWIDLYSLHRLPVPERDSLTPKRITEADNGTPILFTPAKSLHPTNSNKSQPPNSFADLCQLDEKFPKYAAKFPLQHPIEDILLIVVFNYPDLVKNIPLLEYIYGRHFRQVLYCAESVVDFQRIYAEIFKTNPVSFVESSHRNGSLAYDCMSAAIRTRYQVSGYLQIGDDVILNVWNLHNVPRGMPWFQSRLRVIPVDQKTVPDLWIQRNVWGPWQNKLVRRNAAKVYNHLENLLNDTGQTGKRVAVFLNNLQAFTGCKRCLVYEASDIFYLPASVAPEFSFFSDIFLQSQVFLEITIPSILKGITNDTCLYSLRGTYLWSEDRKRYPFVYTEFDHFFHPFKLSEMNDPVHKKFFCKKVLVNIDRDLAGWND